MSNETISKLIFLALLLFTITAFQSLQENHVVSFCEGRCSGGCGAYGGDTIHCWSSDCQCGCRMQWLDDNRNVEDEFSYVADCPG